MNSRRPLSRLLFLGLAVALLAGCSTISSRIQEKSAVFASLDPATQETIRKGGVSVGFTMDMVYMALGSPSERTDRVTKHGHQTIWIYTSRYEEYAGTAHVGYRRVFVRDPKTGATGVILEPVYSDVYRDRIEERIRIIFTDGKVSVIEQAK